MSRKEKKAAEKAEEAVEQQESMRVDLYEWIQSLMTALVIWLTSPTGSHLIARLEMTLNEHPETEMEMIEK